MPLSDDLVVVGKLGRPRGVAGDMYVTPLTDYPERFAGIDEICVRNRDSWENLKVVSSKLISGRPVIRFEGVTSPEQASRLTNRELGVPRDQLVKLPEGTHFIFDLIGCEVVEDGSETPIGTVVEVDQYPANDVYVVEMLSGAQLNVPVVKSFVKHVDIKRKRIRIVMAGLLDNEQT
ncbi:MAG: ribosome maturation factor RimM [candidate division Zixibacteria bacterium]|nr:ribosome maturation factor RimM [candidate division Zixibacteria bacterium]